MVLVLRRKKINIIFKWLSSFQPGKTNKSNIVTIVGLLITMSIYFNDDVNLINSLIMSQK